MKTECVELAKQPGEVNDVIPLIGENPDQHSNNGCNVVLIEFFSNFTARCGRKEELTTLTDLHFDACTYAPPAVDV